MSDATGALDADGLRAASHLNMRRHLATPLAAGAVDEEVAVDAAGRARVTWSPREPLLLLGLRLDLGDETLRVEATLDPDGDPRPLTPLRFDAYSERGSFLPLHTPEVDGGTGRAAPFEVTLTVHGPDGVALSAAEVAETVEVRLVEGQMGRLLYVLGAEKQRIRRVAREIAAMRRVETARDEALDRIGRELGVGRFAERLTWRPAGEGVSGELVTETAREDDAAYRRRLALYRPLLMPTRANALRLLNGDGAAPGPLQRMGLAHAVGLAEADHPFALAVHLVGAAPGGAAAKAFRTRFLAHLRDTRLVDPTVAVPEHRRLPSTQRAREDALRERLRAGLTFESASRAMAPALAAALDRVVACRAALGLADPLQVRRAQRDDGGSRYQLGLGVDLRRPQPAKLAAMAQRALAGQLEAATPPEVRALVASMKPAPADEDPVGRWLLEPCGLRTVHRLDGAWTYASHLYSAGLRISGPDAAKPDEPLELHAHWAADGDSEHNVVLASALAGAVDGWTDEPWTVLVGAAERAAWSATIAADAPTTTAFRAAGLPVVSDVPRLRAALERFPGELVATIQLGPALASALHAGALDAAETLEGLAARLTAGGVASLVPLTTADGRALVVLGAVALPQVGTNRASRRAAGFRWYQVPLHGPGGQVREVGSRTVFTAAGPGLTALVAVGYARVGGTDPYEIRPELPPGATLDLAQYEYLMNALDHLHPMGVEVNTWTLRQAHVDLTGDGVATPLPPDVARTYRPFRRPRHVGDPSVPLEPDPS